VNAPRTPIRFVRAAMARTKRCVPGLMSGIPPALGACAPRPTIRQGRSTVSMRSANAPKSKPENRKFAAAITTMS